ncbi:hypothetical protein, conserved [Eimeria maxima]|uniref:Uncharacterized protein n=1 Tax=Eimeria maxima TaxID=5804 RepID=U6M8U9_EIMMA|nr:hypothetical protein, conserved [Eimeria maxima]CDJ60617.1 hypothetical protein, conserved [Eimeria maxima]
MSATRQVEKMISGSMSAKEGDSSPEEAPQKTGGHADVDTTRDEEEGTQQSEHEVCKRDAEGAEEPAYPIDEGVLTPWWREAGETREPDREYTVLASPDSGNTVGVRRTDEQQGGLCYTWIGSCHPPVRQTSIQAQSSTTSKGEAEKSPRTEAQHGHFQLEVWMAEALWVSTEFRNARGLPDALSGGMGARELHPF